jgi:hypothetical protein
MYEIFANGIKSFLTQFAISFLLLIWVALATLGYCIAMTPVGFGG